MIEVRDLLQSKELKDAVVAIEALVRAHGSTITSPLDSFPSLTYGRRFQAERILQILLADEESFAGFKDVLAAGFAGWLLLPKEREVRDNLMIHAALDHMDRAEIKAGMAEAALTLARDVAARYVLTGVDFLTTIYDVLGGYQAFSDCPNFETVWKRFDGVEKTIATAVRALAYLHHATDQLSGRNGGFTPTLNRTVVVFRGIKKNSPVFFKERYVSRSLLHGRWSQNKQTLALLYAASTVRVNRKSLLQLLLDGFFSYRDHRRYIDLWVGRARYVSHHILARMEDPMLARRTDALLGEGPVIRFAPPRLTPVERVQFDLAFGLKDATV